MNVKNIIAKFLYYCKMQETTITPKNVGDLEKDL